MRLVPEVNCQTLLANQRVVVDFNNFEVPCVWSMVFNVADVILMKLVSQVGGNSFKFVFFRQLNALYFFVPEQSHDLGPHLGLDSKGKSFLDAALDSSLTRSHLVSLKALDDPLQTLERYNFKVEADECQFFEVTELPHSFLDYTVVLGQVDESMYLRRICSK